MSSILESEKIFIDSFSNMNLDDIKIPNKTEIPKYNKFLTNEFAINYIGNMLKDIDIRLYLEFLKMLENNIKFAENYDVENSVCVSKVSLGVTTDVGIVVPSIKNGMDVMAASHELGHGLKSFTKVNKERFLHSDTIYDETISILFGKICLDRYINDFGYDIYAQQFEILNIQNALDCLNKIRTILPEYIRKQDTLERTTEKLVKNNKSGDYKYYSFKEEVEKLKDQLYTLISYPVGISLANIYSNFDKIQQREYLNFVSKFLLNIKQLDYKMILDYFNIPFDTKVFKSNFKEYIEKFNDYNNKKLVLGGNKKW